MSNTYIIKPRGPTARPGILRYIKLSKSDDQITMISPTYKIYSNLKNITPVDENITDESDSEDIDSERDSRNYQVDVSEESETTEELPPSPVRHTRVQDQTFTKDNRINENLVHNLTQNKSSANNNSLVVGILMCVLAVIALFVCTSNSSNTVNNTSIEDEVRNIKRQYPSQDRDTWPKLVSGIQSVINDLPTRPSVFLFLNLDVADDSISHNIATEVAKIAARHLNSNDPLILTPETLNKHEKGAIIENYKDELELHKVMLVTNVHKVNAEVAQSFHYFCDRENPMVKRSILIFTLNVGSNASEDPMKLAEDTLRATWSPPLTDNLILPLITRLTTYVLPITAEKESIS